MSQKLFMLQASYLVTIYTDFGWGVDMGKFDKILRELPEWHIAIFDIETMLAKYLENYLCYRLHIWYWLEMWCRLIFRWIPWHFDGVMALYNFLY